jgi:hypothetical protein
MLLSSFRLQLASEKNIIVQMFGDLFQCKQVYKNKRYFDYLQKFLVKFICGNNIIRKQHISECARYDNELYNVLTEFLN